MTTLQWALLLLGIGIVLALILSSRREKKLLERSVGQALRSRGGVGHDWTPAIPAGAGSDPAHGAFDEYGVGKPRKRSPEIGDAPANGKAEPAQEKAMTPETTAPEKPAAKGPPPMLIALYIAEHEGTNILGPKIHAALKAQGLGYGAKKIYHRLSGEQPVFSVASLVKPGALDPSEGPDFSTPGLSVFMQLPGPRLPTAAFQDMLDTARALAKALNAELFDTEQRAPLTPERERALRTQVQEWARTNPTV